MRFSAFIILAGVLLALTACIVEPDGDGHRHEHHEGHEDREDRDEGRRL